MSVTVPDPVIASTVGNRRSEDGWTVYAVFTASVTVGGVPVFTRTYDDRYGWRDEHDRRGHYRPDYAANEDEARENVLTAFGEVLRDLLSPYTAPR